ncbi:MAG: hypothetical protein HQ518_17875 [Rhodopirellula sp.]|nr:hypothetical protein [Rhodopirellula sp.]
MFTHHKLPRRRMLLVQTVACVALLTCPACFAFPVDFFQTESDQKKLQITQQEEARAVTEAGAREKAARQKKVAEAGVAEEKRNEEPPVEAVNANDLVPVPVAQDAPADNAGAKDKKLEKPRKGVVRQKVAAGAAEAAEEVGQVLGNIFNGLFGGRGREVQARIQDVNQDANALKQFEAQYGRHFDQVVKTELHFIRIVCQPTRQQYDALAADGKLIRTKVLNQFALIQQGMNQGRQPSNDNDTRKPVSEELLIASARHLSPDQVAKYKSELAERDKARQKVIVLATAARLDRKLVLNSQQRTQVTKMLGDNWQAGWGSMQMMIYGGEFYPDLPDSQLIPMLTATQKKVWRTVNQQNQMFWGFNVLMDQGIEIADEQWDDKPADDASADSKAAEATE